MVSIFEMCYIQIIKVCYNEQCYKEVMVYIKIENTKKLTTKTKDVALHVFQYGRSCN